MKKKVVIALLAAATLAIVLMPSQKAEAQVTYGSYCCDSAGMRRCVLVQPAPVNSGCFCPGQGTGLVCL